MGVILFAFLISKYSCKQSLTNYPSPSTTDSGSNNSLKSRQLHSHLHSSKLAVSFSRDRCIYHIHNHSKMKSSTKGTLAHSFSSRTATCHFEYLKRKIGSLCVCVFFFQPVCFWEKTESPEKSMGRGKISHSMFTAKYMMRP
jgi:hypothetical protein